MNHLHRQLLSLVVVAALLSAACQKGDAVSYTKEAVAGLKDVRVIFVANGLAVANIDKAIVVGEAAVVALDAGSANALETAAAFITAFESVAGDADLIPNVKVRTAVLIGLLVANVALHHLADVLANQSGTLASRARSSSAGSQIAAFHAKPVWKCRNASTGRFEKADFCKAHPDNSVVERY